MFDVDLHPLQGADEFTADGMLIWSIHTCFSEHAYDIAHCDCFSNFQTSPKLLILDMLFLVSFSQI
jgi:hypothetical protein